MANSSGRREQFYHVYRGGKPDYNGNHNNNCHQIFDSFLFQSASCIKVTNSGPGAFGQRDMLGAIFLAKDI